ncbi:hypothetical protein lerEdw1_010997 [Lerista edwardsae]|nr:hypothetical protein lerEdw1_010997 [Lerista edwardsae]
MERLCRPAKRLLGVSLLFSLLVGASGDFCKVNRCQNGGTCLTGISDSPFFCICTEGFTGIDCNETEKGPCHPNPCLNNGECKEVPNRGDVFTEYVCNCPSGYDGKHCQNSECGVFSGNVDNDSPVTNLFNPPITAQYIRIYPVVCRRACTLRFELIGCEMNGCSEYLGMKSHFITDKQITASSVYRTWGIDAFAWHPHYARLDKTGKSNAWAALNNKEDEWLQIDLQRPKKVTGLITQGARDFGHIQYVASYKVAHSDDGKFWTLYKDNWTNNTKIFQGNYDNNSHKKNVFDVPFYARFVRILPESWHNRITLRVELLGCDE